MTEFIQVTVAINSEEGAHRITEALINERLAASVWVSGPITSMYWWKDKAEKATEWVCTIKTRSEHYSDIERTIKELHPYEVPGILATSVVEGSPDYLEWIESETHKETQKQPEYPREEGTSKEQLLQELIDAHERLIAIAAKVSERGAIRTAGMWGPREIMAHIAAWEAMAVSRIPEIIKGMPPITYTTQAQHTAMDNAINETAITLMGDQSFEAVRNILQKTYRRDVQMLRELDDALFTSDNYIYNRTKAAIEHVNEHAQELEEQQS